MEQKKLLEYAQYGCTQKMIGFIEFVKKTNSMSKASIYEEMYMQTQEDCKEINRMIQKLS